MAFDTATAQVRLLIADLDVANQVLTDDQVNGYLALNGVTDPSLTEPRGSIKRAAADALAAIATSEVLLSKVIRTGDGLSTDGAKVAAELRAQAAGLRAQAELDDAQDAQSSDTFGVVEFRPWAY